MLGHGAATPCCNRGGAAAADRRATASVAGLAATNSPCCCTGSCRHMEADTVASRIVRRCASRSPSRATTPSAGASVGIAVYPAHAANAEELLGHADLALYYVKANGRNGFHLFDHEMKSRLQRRKALETELRDAIAEDELELYYQPIVEATGTGHGYEALMRWNHPRRGFLPPIQFIPVAEEAGLMADLGNWAISAPAGRRGCCPTISRVAVNVSPNQFRSAGIVDGAQALAETGLAASRLVLEVTEIVILSSEPSPRASSPTCAALASIWRSTISAPAIPRSATCSALPSPR